MRALCDAYHKGRATHKCSILGISGSKGKVIMIFYSRQQTKGL